jgi:hypothetical protein
MFILDPRNFSCRILYKKSGAKLNLPFFPAAGFQEPVIFVAIFILDTGKRTNKIKILLRRLLNCIPVPVPTIINYRTE